MGTTNKQREETVAVEGLLVNETTKAYLVAVDNNPKNEVWFPKSQLTDVDIKNDEINFELPEWLAKEKGVV